MDEQIFKALEMYFFTLRQVGYKSYEEVKKLLFLVAVNEIIDGDFNGGLSEEDYRDINAAVYCIYGTDCMFPYPNQCKCNK